MKQLRILPAHVVASAMVVALCVGIAPLAAFAAAGATSRVSVSTVGAEGNAGCLSPSISASGRFVVFETGATNIVAGDTNGQTDVFLRDRQTGVTERVSVGYQGQALGGGSFSPVVSTDGRYVAFYSEATNLVAGDTNGISDVFVRDRALGVTTRVSVNGAGAQVAGGSWDPAISPDGRYVAFDSESAGLVAGDTNGQPDIFVRDRLLGTTERVSVGVYGQATGAPSGVPCISSDGRYVAFFSDADDLTVADTNGKRDIFLRDRTLGVTTRVSVDSAGVQANFNSDLPSISADGRYVAYHSYATNLVAGDTNVAGDAFVRDTVLGTTELVSLGTGGQGNGESYVARVSADGRYVAFASEATNLVVGDTNGHADVFVRDRTSGTTTRVSLSSAGGEGNGFSWTPSMSGDGRYVAFASMASSLVPNDTNAQMDIFVNDAQVVATSATIRTTATSAVTGSAPILSGRLTPAGLVGWNMVAYVKKPGRAYWTYSSNRTVYTLSGGAAWYYKYTFKKGMTKGVYYFRATVPALPGYATSNSSIISIRLR